MPIVPKPYTHVANTLAEAAKVNANDDAMYGLVNGGLTDVNILASAGILQSKILGLLDVLGTRKLSADLYRLIDRTEVIVASTAVETALTAAPIPAATMNASDTINGKHVALITSILTGSSLFLRFYWGGTLVHDAEFTNSSGSTMTDVGLTTDFQIFNRSSLASQGMSFVTAQNSSAGSAIKSQVTGATKDTSVQVLFQVNALWTVGSASNSVRGLGLELFRQR